MAKSNRKQALGRGLSALLNDSENAIESINDKNADQVIGSIIELDLDKISTNPFQPRTHFNEQALEELSQSVKELGVIQPITVRKKGSSFELIAGERRFRACEMAGLKTIPAFVRLADDQESLEMALVENIQRQDLDPIEIGLSYQRLIDEIKLTQDQLSTRVGKKRSTITNYMRLLKLDPIIQTGIRDSFISMGHGRALINVDSPKEQIKLYKTVVKKRLSVRETEALVRKLKAPKVAPNKIYQPAYIDQAANELETLFDTPVTASANSQGQGQLKISFESQEKLQHILNKIKGEN
ncbi:ParB/RepB/Spo0J family partition protein [Flavobacteriaceae bacterium]|nr:ParB/RepB/Spo0J family partition protein [Flavobacteriaceae bacterium]MDA9015815.1 ParB/RepB/Spo0J family partition protein [Flavobacteriaceae bacterium]MDC3354118.1 ParB/RepB/Spo0J family partition protein [Flavobacteriaceae bacterium]